MSESNTITSNGVSIKDLCYDKKAFLAKWGPDWDSLIIEFVEKSPSFEGDIELARKIGYLIADIQSSMIDGC
jgi:hypothetical protein